MINSPPPEAGPSIGFPASPVVNSFRQGKGVPVILIHGLAASLRDWDFLVPDLVAGGYEACALDLLGHGDSGKPTFLEEYNVNNVFNHMSGWIEKLELREPFILLGHSLGGYLALDYTIRYPGCVRALILVNPFYSLRQLSSLLRFTFQRQLLNTAFIECTPYWLFRIVIDVTSPHFGSGREPLHSLPESVRIQTTMDYKRASPGIYNIPRTMQELNSYLTGVTAPTLVIWGRHDRTLARASFQELVRALPNGYGVEIPACGHVPHQCHAEWFNLKVMSFLANL